MENKLVRGIVIVIVVLLLGAGAWYLLREPDISNQRGRADDVRDALGSVGEQQQRAAESAGRIESGLERSVESTERIEERVIYIESAVDHAAAGNEELIRIVADSQQRVGESQRIIQGIRNRAGQN